MHRIHLVAIRWRISTTDFKKSSLLIFHNPLFSRLSNCLPWKCRSRSRRTIFAMMLFVGKYMTCYSVVKYLPCYHLRDIRKSNKPSKVLLGRYEGQGQEEEKLDLRHSTTNALLYWRWFFKKNFSCQATYLYEKGNTYNTHKRTHKELEIRVPCADQKTICYLP